MRPINPQECAIKMGVFSQTAETVQLLADKVACKDFARTSSKQGGIKCRRLRRFLCYSYILTILPPYQFICVYKQL